MTLCLRYLRFCPCGHAWEANLTDQEYNIHRNGEPTVHRRGIPSGSPMESGVGHRLPGRPSLLPAFPTFRFPNHLVIPAGPAGGTGFCTADEVSAGSVPSGGVPLHCDAPLRLVLPSSVSAHGSSARAVLKPPHWTSGAPIKVPSMRSVRNNASERNALLSCSYHPP